MPSLEHGGVSQRSSMPQQVVPFGFELPIITALGAVNCFSKLSLPHFSHLGFSDCLIMRKSNTAPQSLHLYVYIGIRSPFLRGLKKADKEHDKAIKCLPS
jgi:hypothetical protein